MRQVFQSVTGQGRNNTEISLEKNVVLFNLPNHPAAVKSLYCTKCTQWRLIIMRNFFFRYPAVLCSRKYSSLYHIEHTKYGSNYKPFWIFFECCRLFILPEIQYPSSDLQATPTQSCILVLRGFSYITCFPWSTGSKFFGIFMPKAFEV